MYYYDLCKVSTEPQDKQRFAGTITYYTYTTESMYQYDINATVNTPGFHSLACDLAQTILLQK